MNLPNRITLARICLIPIMMFFLLVDFRFYPEPLHWGSFQLSINHLIAAVIFLLAASTDGIDGYIARKYNMVTNLGKLLDPLADKLLVSAVLISLVELGRCDSWIAIVIISREFAVTGLRKGSAARRQSGCRQQMGQDKDSRADCRHFPSAAQQLSLPVRQYPS